MADIEQGIAALIQQAGHGTGGTAITIGGMQSEPDRQIAVARFDGPPDETYTTVHDRPGIQIRVRTGRGAHLEGVALALAVKDTLDGIGRVTAAYTDALTGDPAEVSIETLRPQGSLIPLGRDEDNRPEFSINYEVTYG